MQFPDHDQQIANKVEKGSSLTALLAEVETLRGAVVEKIFDSPIFSGISVASAGHELGAFRGVKTASNAWKSRSVTIGSRSSVDPYSAEVASANYSVHGMTGVDLLHAAGIYGKGVQIALISTGVDYTHPAVSGLVENTLVGGF